MPDDEPAVKPLAMEPPADEDERADQERAVREEAVRDLALRGAATAGALGGNAGPAAGALMGLGGALGIQEGEAEEAADDQTRTESSIGTTPAP